MEPVDASEDYVTTAPDEAIGQGRHPGLVIPAVLGTK